MAAQVATWHNAAVRTSLPLILVPLALGCGPSLPDVVEGRDVPEASGSPSIDGIVDLGGRASTGPGPLRPDGPSDGAATIGELVLLRGDDLGRMPRVTIGGRPATTEAYTTAGIVVRVPPGVAPGGQPFVVEHSGGRARHGFPVRRWAVVVADGRLHPIAVDARGARAGESIPISGARAVRFAAEGAVAYVLGDQLTVLDVAAQKGPRIVVQRDLPAPAEHLVVAQDRSAGRGALVSGSTIVMMDLTRPYEPAYWTARPLPEGQDRPPTAAEMDDAGKRLALLHGNRVSFVDISDVAEPRPSQTVDILPGVRPPLGTHLRFAHKDALWVLAGDNPGSEATGTQPLRLLRIREGAVDATRMLGSGAPAALAIAPEARTIRGSTIHRAEMTPILVAFSGGKQAGGAVIRVDDEGVTPVLESDERLLAMAAASGALLVATCRDGQLGVRVAGGEFVALEAPCPEEIDMAAQP